MFRIFLFPAVLTLVVACDGPSPGFRGAVASRHVVEGTEFTVHVKDDTAQALRTTNGFSPRIGPLAGRAAIAMQQASGCRVTRMGGDAAVLVGYLSCGKTPVRSCEVDATLTGPRGFRAPVVRSCG